MKALIGHRTLTEDDDLVLEFPELEGYEHITSFHCSTGDGFEQLAELLQGFPKASVIAHASSGDHARLIAGYNRIGFTELCGCILVRH